jgi:undecaprenyl-diphosphatase
MALADLRGDVARRCEDARPIDGLWLGVAQACALIPGVSRNGATLAAARARGFDRRDANALSLYCAFPVVIGAVVLKSVRLARAGGSAPTHLLGAGAGAAFASTLVARPLVDRAARRRSLIPYFVYRVALAAVVICKLRENGRR